MSSHSGSEPEDHPGESVNPPDQPVNVPDQPLNPLDRSLNPPNQPLNPASESTDPPNQPLDPASESTDPPAPPGNRRQLTLRILRVALPVAIGVATAGAAVAAAPVAIAAAGFGAGGIAAGSFAASMMSSAATTGVGMGIVSVLQSAGAAGLALSSQILIGTAVGATTAGISGAALHQVPTEEGTRPGAEGGNGNDAGGGTPRGECRQNNHAAGSAQRGECRQNNHAAGSAQRGEGRQNNHAAGSAQRRECRQNNHAAGSAQRGEGRQNNHAAGSAQRRECRQNNHAAGSAPRGEGMGDNGPERDNPVGNTRQGDLKAELQERSHTEGRSCLSRIDSTENSPSGNISGRNASRVTQNVEIRIAGTERGLTASEIGLTAPGGDWSASEVNSPDSPSIDYDWGEDPDGRLSLQWSDVDRHLPPRKSAAVALPSNLNSRSWLFLDPQLDPPYEWV
ncbi:hypothetical protein BsWGS_28271 [Bradybaena similaris]